MKRMVPVLLAAGMAVGCQPAPDTSVDVTPSSGVTTASTTSTEVTLVTLNVPNMT